MSKRESEQDKEKFYFFLKFDKMFVKGEYGSNLNDWAGDMEEEQHCNCIPYFTENQSW